MMLLFCWITSHGLRALITLLFPLPEKFLPVVWTPMLFNDRRDFSVQLETLKKVDLSPLFPRPLSIRALVWKKLSLKNSKERATRKLFWIVSYLISAHSR